MAFALSIMLKFPRSTQPMPLSKTTCMDSERHGERERGLSSSSRSPFESALFQLVFPKMRLQSPPRTVERLQILDNAMSMTSTKKSTIRKTLDMHHSSESKGTERRANAYTHIPASSLEKQRGGVILKTLP